MEEKTLTSEQLQKRTMWTVIIIAASVLVLFVATLVIVAVIENRKANAEIIKISGTEIEATRLQDTDDELYEVKITGTAKNLTNDEYSFISIVFALYDDDGEFICYAYASYYDVTSDFNKTFTAKPTTTEGRGGYLTKKPKTFAFVRVDVTE